MFAVLLILISFLTIGFPKINKILSLLKITHVNIITNNPLKMSAIKKAGIKNPKALPIANKTSGKKKDLSEYYTKEIQSLALFVFFINRSKVSIKTILLLTTIPARAITPTPDITIPKG